MADPHGTLEDGNIPEEVPEEADDKCWFCGSESATMTRSHVLLHCPNERLRSARVEAWEGKDPGVVRVLLASPRWEAVC
jgi:hypothetical protein